MSQLQFQLGAAIHCRDGQAGRLHRVVIDPRTLHVLNLVVERGFLYKRDRVIPVSVVEHTTADEVYLTIDSKQLSGYPEYREVDYTLPAPGWQSPPAYKREQVHVWSCYGGMSTEYAAVPQLHYHTSVGIPADSASIGRATPVHSQNHLVGKVDQLLIDPQNWELTHVIVRKGILPHELIIPIAWVKSVASEGIVLQGYEEAVA